MSEPRLPQDEEDLMRNWQETPVSAPNPSDLARQIADQVARFDRRSWWRNAREYAAGVLLLAMAVKGVMEGKPAALLMGAAALLVMGYLWWNHRGRRPLDAGADARAYQAAMLKRYDDQIAFLSNTRYWYLLPLYVPVVWITAIRWPQDPGRAALLFASATAGFVVLWWVSERFAVRRLKKGRAEVAAMLESTSAH
jgi:hypothetical protein